MSTIALEFWSGADGRGDTQDDLASAPFTWGPGQSQSTSSALTLLVLRGPDLSGAMGSTQRSPETPGSLEGNTEGPGTASSEPLLPS